MTDQKPKTAEILTTLTDEDLRALRSFMPVVFEKINASAMNEYTPKIIEADSADLIVARDQKRTIVSAMIVNQTYAFDKIRGRIDDLATDESHRRQGYGGAVLDRSLQWFRDRRIDSVTLHSEDGRDPAHQLYKSRGFSIQHTNVFKIFLGN